MKRISILNEILPTLQDLCNGFNLTSSDSKARFGYTLAISAVCEIAINLNILIRVYQTMNGEYITRFSYDAFIDQSENGTKQSEIKMIQVSKEMKEMFGNDKELLHGVPTWYRRNPAMATIIEIKEKKK